MSKYFPIYEDTVSHLWLCNCSTLNFLIYKENSIFFFVSVLSLCKVLPRTIYVGLKTLFAHFTFTGFNHLMGGILFPRIEFNLLKASFCVPLILLPPPPLLQLHSYILICSTPLQLHPFSSFRKTNRRGVHGRSFLYSTSNFYGVRLI
jgi:hypothetical protein